MAESFTSRYALSQYTAKHVGWNEGYNNSFDIIDAVLGLVKANAGDTDEGTLDDKSDGITIDVDSTNKHIYVKKLTLTHNIASNADYTLNVATFQDRYSILKITDTGVLLTATRNIIVPSVSNVYIVKNETAQNLIIKTSGGSGVTVGNSTSALVFCDGTNVYGLT